MGGHRHGLSQRASPVLGGLGRGSQPEAPGEERVTADHQRRDILAPLASRGRPGRLQRRHSLPAGPAWGSLGGIGERLQLGKTLFAALQVTTGGYVGSYPIALAGSSTIACVAATTDARIFMRFQGCSPTPG